MLGADMEASDFIAAVKASQLAFAGLICALCLAVYLGFACSIDFKLRLESVAVDEKVPLIVQWGTAAVVGLTGAVITVALFYVARQDALDGFSAIFRRQAFARSEAIYQTLSHSLEDADDLRRFHENFKSLNRRVATRFADPMAKKRQRRPGV